MTAGSFACASIALEDRNSSKLSTRVQVCNYPRARDGASVRVGVVDEQEIAPKSIKLKAAAGILCYRATLGNRMDDVPCASVKTNMSFKRVPSLRLAEGVLWLHRLGSRFRS